MFGFDNSEALKIIDDALQNNDFQLMSQVEDGSFRIGASEQEAAAELFVKALNNLNYVDSIIRSVLGLKTYSNNEIELVRRVPKVLLSNGLSANSFYEGKSLLHNAIETCTQSNHIEYAADLLIQHGANVNNVDNKGYSCLGSHLKKGYGTRYKYTQYIANGAKLNQTDLADRSVFVTIFQNGLFDVLNLVPKDLLNYNLLNDSDENGFTLLHYAVCGPLTNTSDQAFIERRKLEYNSDNDYVRIVRFLLDCGADPNVVTPNGQTPLFLASGLGHYTVLKELVANTSNINGQTGGTMTPLFIAAYNNQIEAVMILLQAGADVNTKSFVYYKFEKKVAPGLPQEVSAMLSLLFTRRATEPDVFILMDLGIPNLYYPALFEYTEMTEPLLAAGANPNDIALNGLFPLYLAAERGNARIVQSLISAGAEVDKKTNYGWTSLQNAADEGHCHVVELLIKHGANVNNRRHNGFTPLKDAIESNRRDVVILLQKYGATL